jgi:hypothetical protein
LGVGQNTRNNAPPPGRSWTQAQPPWTGGELGDQRQPDARPGCVVGEALLHLISSRHGEVATRSGVRLPRQTRRTRPPSAGPPAPRPRARRGLVADSARSHARRSRPWRCGPAEPAHRTQPRLQPAVVTLDVVVGMPIGAMADHRQQLLQHRRVHRRMVGDDLNGRDLGRTDGPLEEAAGSPSVMLGGDKDIDDLAE